MKRSQGILTALGVLFLLNILVILWPVRLDMTRDKRYTPSDFFLKQVTQLESSIRVKVFLDGDLPPVWMALKTTTRDFFRQYALAGGQRMEVEWVPVANLTADAKQALLNEIRVKGGRPIGIKKQTKDGSLLQEIIIPCALVSYQDKEVLINFLEQGQLNLSEKELASTLQRYDFLLSNAILTLTTQRTKQLAIVVGNESLSPLQTRMIADHLNQYYKVSYVQAKDSIGEWDRFAVVIIAKPTEAFSEKRKYILDQYLMQGGAVAFFIDGAQIQEGQLSQGKDAVVMGLDVGLQDLLFHYGLRLQNNVLKDEQCAFIPVQSLQVQNSTQFEPAPWAYYPLFQGEKGSSISDGLFSILGRFVSGIDTLAQKGIHKEVILQSSPHTTAVGLPGTINLSEIIRGNDEQNHQQFITGVVCEGMLQSAFRNRSLEVIAGDLKSPPNQPKMLQQSTVSVRYALISDGDMLRNEISAGVPLSLGYDRFLKKEVYSNLSFVANLVHYLAGEHEWLELRNRKWEQSLLDKQKVRDDYFAAVFLLAISVLIWILGVYFAVIGYRRYRFGTKKRYDEK